MSRTPTLPSSGGLKNPAWKYVPAESTDLAKRFREMASLPANVASIKKRKEQAK